MDSIPDYIKSKMFLGYIKAEADLFKARNGYGRWLHEYEQMEAEGGFEPARLRDCYMDILAGVNTLPFLEMDAVNHICSRAHAKAAEDLGVRAFELRTVEGDRAVDEDGDDLAYLTMSEARALRDKMNNGANEYLYWIYDCQTGKYIGNHG